MLQAETQTGASLSALPPFDYRPRGASPLGTRVSKPRRPRFRTGKAALAFCAQTFSRRLWASAFPRHP